MVMNKHSGFPVLRCVAGGDQEGRTLKQLGYYSGRIEDILRLVAPRATHAQARFGADYELNVEYYDSIDDVYANLSVQQGLSEEERHPHIILVPTQRPIAAKVVVHIDKLTQCIVKLLPETRREKKNYTDGTTSNLVIIEL
jgi:hypothetical protein